MFLAKVGRAKDLSDKSRTDESTVILNEVKNLNNPAWAGRPQLTNLMHDHFVYIMSNKSRTLYTGVTKDLSRRAYEHKSKLIPGFTQRYNITKLVYFEATSDINSAIAREKQIKGWLRKKKIELIESMNPEWEDLAPQLNNISSDPSALVP